MKQISNMDFSNVEIYRNQGKQAIADLNDSITDLEEIIENSSSQIQYYIKEEQPTGEINNGLVWLVVET